MAELLRRLKRHARGYYNFAKRVIYKHLFEACPGVNCILLHNRLIYINILNRNNQALSVIILINNQKFGIIKTEGIIYSIGGFNVNQTYISQTC